MPNITPYISDRTSLRQGNQDWYKELTRNDREILNVLQLKYPADELLTSVIEAITYNDTYIIRLLVDEYSGYLPFSWYDIYNLAESDAMRLILKGYKPPYEGSAETDVSEYYIGIVPEARNIILYDDWDEYLRKKAKVQTSVRFSIGNLKFAWNRVVADLMKDKNILYRWTQDLDDVNPEQLDMGMKLYLKMRNDPGNVVLLKYIFSVPKTYKNILYDLLDKYLDNSNAIDMVVSSMADPSVYRELKPKLEELVDHLDWFEYYMDSTLSLANKPKDMYPLFWKLLLTAAIRAGSAYLARSIIMKESENIDKDMKLRLIKVIRELFPITRLDKPTEDFAERESLIKSLGGTPLDEYEIDREWRDLRHLK